MLASYSLLQHNLRNVPCQKSGKDWLRSAPRGAYTAIRTVGRDKIFEFTFHINRLTESVRLMGQRGNCDGDWCFDPPIQIIDPEKLRPLLIQALQAAANKYSDLYPWYMGELRIIVLITWGIAQENIKGVSGYQGRKQEYDLFLHMEPLPAPPRHPIKVLVHGHPRENPVAKDSEWVRDRVSLEMDKPKDVNEVLLIDEDRGILEGMTSNFFVVHNGKVVTSQHGVLRGSVRDLVLRVCREADIQVQWQAPNLNQIHEYQGAFITSTSRLVLKIDELKSEDCIKYFGECQVVDMVKELVLTNVEKLSEQFINLT
eukprot:TRINITY_DN5870_c0_g1_i3.p1 TRINITY_DN5870_c0_g1~~TRINITY_DN5870_c0_g1_i3.p1  ORF type:complete len:314 (+),score=13.47 TRINITY_DN5870_c0_g1_i3:70-1011(+)